MIKYISKVSQKATYLRIFKGSRMLYGDEVMDVIQRQEDRIAELKEIVKAVAHIGVDFGYGKYELEAGKIDDARTLMEQDND
jgi:hypothetical protein